MKYLVFGAAILAGAGCAGLALAAAGPNVLKTHSGIGKKYFARDPRTCTSTADPGTGPVTAQMARQYVICRNEFVQGSSGNLFLVTNMNVQVGTALSAQDRRALFLTDAAANSPVYPIRGSFDWYQCFIPDGDKPDSFGVPPLHPPGKNCSVQHEVHAAGHCYRTSFGDWNCNMNDPNALTVAAQPAPGYAAVAAGNAAATAAPSVPAVPAQPSTKGMQASSGPAAIRPAAKSPAGGAGSDIQDGMTLFRQGKYRAAFGKFHAAVQRNLNDPLARLWEGVTIDALGGGRIGGSDSGWDYLAANNDPNLGIAANELLALSDWHRGDRANAETVLETCIRSHPADSACADMKQGIESGASAPNVSDWPADVGLVKATKAGSVVWKPKS